jgi:peptide deformylase
MKILKFPHEDLRMIVGEFNFEQPQIDPVQLEKDLIETMLSNDGIGLAAPQVGMAVRVFVMGYKASPELAQAFFNPEVLKCTEETEELEEGCLSFPGIYATIKRPKKILARWQNSKGEWQESEFDGYNCKCFLHELDHLEGVVFKDRVSSLKWDRAVKQSKPKKAKLVRVKRKY